MKFRTVFGLAAIGGILYLHRKNGGEWTLASLRDSARKLIGDARERATELEDRAKAQVHDVAATVVEATETHA